MGYTHYWFRTETTRTTTRRDKALFDAFSWDASLIVRYSTGQGIVIGDYSGDTDSESTWNENYFSFNGVGENSYESFVWTAYATREQLSESKKGSIFESCKTGRRPYDSVVTAILLRALDYYTGTLTITSDGSHDDWQNGRDLYKNVFALEVPESSNCLHLANGVKA